MHKNTRIGFFLLSLAIGWSMLLAACATDRPGATASYANQTPGATGAIATTTLAPTPVTRPAIDCPATGTTRAATMSPNSGTVPPAVFYLTSWGGVQTSLHPLNLVRYDLASGKTASIFSFGGTTIGTMPHIQLSPDKNWFLLVTNNTLGTTNTTSIQLMRTDGSQFQTLSCPTSPIQSATWLPDGQHVAITSGGYDQQHNSPSYTVKVLNLATGTSQTVLSGDYFPYGWLDNHRLIVETLTGVAGTRDQTDFFLYDINNGNQQKRDQHTRLASFPTWGSFLYGDIAIGDDGSRIFTSSFTQADANPDNCRGATSKGPGTLNAYQVASGSTHTIYSSQNFAITTIQPASPQTLLVYVENNTGDLSQNGLWKINTDGSGLTRLISVHDQKCRDLNYSEWSPQIASNGQRYALVLSDSTKGYSQSIVVGNLAEGTPTTIATDAHLSPKAGFDGFLQLVGMV